MGTLHISSNIRPSVSATTPPVSTCRSVYVKLPPRSSLFRSAILHSKATLRWDTNARQRATRYSPNCPFPRQGVYEPWLPGDITVVTNEYYYSAVESRKLQEHLTTEKIKPTTVSRRIRTDRDQTSVWRAAYRIYPGYIFFKFQKIYTRQVIQYWNTGEVCNVWGHPILYEF